MASPFAVLRRFAGDSRGGAAIELAVGTVALIAVATATLDLYFLMSASAASGRAAMIMSDYVSRDTAPDSDELSALGRFLHAHEITVPSDFVSVISAFHQPDGDPLPDADLLWSDDSIRIGDSTVTAELAATCTRFSDGATADLPSDFAMSAGEVLIIVEVCARLTGEGSLTGLFLGRDIYRAYGLPARNTDALPLAPAPSAGLWADGMETLASLDRARLRGVAPLYTGPAPPDRPALTAVRA